MTKPKMTGACYQCKYRGTVPGSAHSSCKHPDIETSPLGELMGILGSVGRVPPEMGNAGLKTTIKAVGTPHGVRKGWFMWPYNFDPTWLEECNGFTEKDTEKET